MASLSPLRNSGAFAFEVFFKMLRLARRWLNTLRSLRRGWWMRVEGQSMEPALRPGDAVFFCPPRAQMPRVGEIVIAKDPRNGRAIVKRVSRIQGGEIYLLGDNPQCSTDSRVFGAIGRQDWLGRALLRVSVDPIRICFF